MKDKQYNKSTQLHTDKKVKHNPGLKKERRTKVK
jgi:hypothetical protein